MTIRARFDGKVFVPIDPVVDLRADQIVDLDVHEATIPPRGSGAAVLRAIQSPPHLEPGDADALERSIEEGKIPPQSGGIFDDLRDE
jgi:hypothetical protein